MSMHVVAERTGDQQSDQHWSDGNAVAITSLNVFSSLLQSMNCH